MCERSYKKKRKEAATIEAFWLLGIYTYNVPIVTKSPFRYFVTDEVHRVTKCLMFWLKKISIGEGFILLDCWELTQISEEKKSYSFLPSPRYIILSQLVEI